MVECVTYLRVSKNDGLRERDYTFNSKDMANVNDNSVCSADNNTISSITNSVENQRKLLERFILKNDFKHIAEFVDEGYTGTNFNRPGFIKMLGWIEKNNVRCIMVKDLSRLGRDYIETGRLLEYYFPMNNIRVISVSDGYDSDKADYHERKITVPLLNLLNDSYARDISCKVRYSQKVKRESGKYIGAFAVYGYKKSDSDKNRLVIDDVAAKVVKQIFDMRIAGYSAEKIVRAFNEEKILSPYMYKKANNSNYKTSFANSEMSVWKPYSVRRILNNEIYTGVLQQGKTRKINYKLNKRINLNKEEWVCCEETVPAIISKEQFMYANISLSNRKKCKNRTPSGITTRLRTTSPDSLVSFISSSGIFGGYSAYSVWGGITNTSALSGSFSSIGIRLMFCIEVSPGKTSVPAISTSS